MEEMVQEMMNSSPGYACILAVIWFGMRWHERIATHWVESFKEVGQKCHESHEKVANMFYEQSCKGQEVLTANTGVLSKNMVQLKRCADAHEEEIRVLRDRN